MKYLDLVTGQKLPIIGIGTLQSGNKCSSAITEALRLGYRHIDTATFYNNHSQVAKSIKECKIMRDEIFITSKVWRDSLDYKSILTDCENVLLALKIEYIDLYLVHRPNLRIPLNNTYKALSELVDKGLVRNLGISNFNNNMLDEVASVFNRHPISVIQDEFNPYYQDIYRLRFCKTHKIAFVAYSPLANGAVINDFQLKVIAKLYNRSVSQVVLRWLIEKKIAVIPMSSDSTHIGENINLFDFELDTETAKLIDTFNINKRTRDYNLQN